MRALLDFDMTIALPFSACSIVSTLISSFSSFSSFLLNRTSSFSSSEASCFGSGRVIAEGVSDSTTGALRGLTSSLMGSSFPGISSGTTSFSSFFSIGFSTGTGATFGFL